MKAVFLLAPKKLEIMDVKVPEPDTSEIIIKVEAANTCGTDYKMFRRGYPLFDYPIPFGHEYSGIVAKTGSGVSKFKEGDAVFSIHSAPCQKCRYCKKGLFNLCTDLIPTMKFGAFAEFFKVSSRIVEQNAYHKPANIDFAQAALVEPLACVLNGISNLNLEFAENIVIFGAGPIGLFFISVLSQIYKKKVLVVEPDRFRRNLAIDYSADAVISPTGFTDVEFVEYVRNWNNGFLADVVIEASGYPTVFNRAFNCADKGGQVLFFAGPPENSNYNLSINQLHYDQINVLGVFHLTPESVSEAKEMIISGKPHFGKFLTHQRKFDDIIDVFQNPPANSIKTTIIP